MGISSGTRYKAPNEIATSGALPPPRNDGSGEDGFSINSDQSEIDRRRAGLPFPYGVGCWAFRRRLRLPRTTTYTIISTVIT